MHIVIDSNVVYHDFRLGRTYFRVLLDNVRRTGELISSPGVVLDEIRNQYAEGLRETFSSVRQGLARLGRMLERELNSPLSEEELEAETQAYSVWLLERLRAEGVTILEYPQVKHEGLVKRDLARRKPFDREGRGYRDALIWETVVALVKSEGGEIAFVSNNARDFGDREGNLHGDLTRILRRLNVQGCV